MDAKKDATPQILASKEDWDALSSAFGDFELVADDDLDDGLEDLLAPSDEVQRVSRRIAGQYVEVLAHFSASVFGRRVTRITTDQVLSAIDALLRLARASQDDQQESLLHELHGLVEPATSGRRNSRTRQSATRQLRDWIPRFAVTLESTDGARLERLVTWDDEAAPLLDELSGIHGIGPKRLGRLYAAGLFTVDSVASSDPTDITSVTGIPQKLAEEVVAATHAYALAERQRCVEGLVSQANRLRNILKAVPMGELSQSATDALKHVEQTLRDIEQSMEPSP